jgi:CRP/FNR family transcriptional regulator, cyclic AMP receptor protein
MMIDAGSEELKDHSIAGAPSASHARYERKEGRRRRGRRSEPRSLAAEIDWADVPALRVEYERDSTIFSQGDLADSIMFIETGAVWLSVVSQSGRQAVVGVLEAGRFFGESCLAGQSTRAATARTVRRSTILTVEQHVMARQLHTKPGFTHVFIAHLLRRNIRVEEDLVNQLFNSSEQRLARALLLLARWHEDGTSSRVIPRVSQEILAEIVGTTRARVNLFMNRFRKLGLIAYEASGDLTINRSLSTVALQD